MLDAGDLLAPFSTRNWRRKKRSSSDALDFNVDMVSTTGFEPATSSVLKELSQSFQALTGTLSTCKSN